MTDECPCGAHLLQMKDREVARPTRCGLLFGETRLDQKIRLAYLLFVYHQPEQLARLIRVLDKDGAYFFVHVDRKVDLAPFLSAIPKKENIVFIKDRVKVYWGGFSQIRAIMKLINTAYSFELKMDYFFLLSGSDYPVRPISELVKLLTESETNYIRIDRLISDTSTPHIAERLQNFCLNDVPALNPKSGWAGPLPRIAQRLLRLIPSRKYPANMPTPYHGTTYWCLKRNCISYILKYLKENPEFYHFFRYFLCTDEVIFHTIIKKSEFAKTIAHDFEHDTNRGNIYGLHYIDWSKFGSLHPKILDEGDFNAIVDSGAYFARKLEIGLSDSLLDLIDKNIHKNSPDNKI